MKFIHTGDIHWGMSPDSDKPWSRERSRDIRDTFTAIIAKAKELRVDCLFIAGDLFHRQPLLRDLKEVNYLFSTIPQTQVVIIAGNHDRIRKNSAVLSFSWASNVTFLESEDVSSVYFEDINTEVTGFSYYTAEIPEPRLDALEAPEDGKIHILLGHKPRPDRPGGAGFLRIFVYRTGAHPQARDPTGQKDGILRFPGAA